MVSSGHHALREGANFGTIQKGVRKIGRNARCVLSLKEPVVVATGEMQGGKGKAGRRQQSASSLRRKQEGTVLRCSK